MPSGPRNRCLFFTASAACGRTVADAPEFRSTFTAADVPTLRDQGAWFNGSTFVPIHEFGVGFDQANAS
jgi:hypothetical protein